MRIAHISDSHLSQEHPHRTSNLQSCIDVIKASNKLPDAVIHTGDVTHDGLAEEYLIAKSVLDTLNIPYFVMPGNRDNRQEMSKVFADDKNIHLNNQHIQYCVEDFPVRLIVLDTLSENTNKGEFDKTRLTHLQELLQKDKRKPTAIFMHHTPFRVDAIPDPFQFANWNDVEALEGLLDEHQQICGIFCGHIHRSIEGTLGKHTVRAISCMATDLRKGDLTEAERLDPIVHLHQLPNLNNDD